MTSSYIIISDIINNCNNDSLDEILSEITYEKLNRLLFHIQSKMMDIENTRKNFYQNCPKFGEIYGNY
jgi:hypothetical protein